MLRNIKISKKIKELEYIVIGGVPVLYGNDYIVVHPKLNNLIVEVENNIDYILLKKHKKKFLLDNCFYNEEEELKLYYEYFDMIGLKIINQTFLIRDEKFEINKSTTTKELLASNIVLNLQKIYDVKIIDQIINTILKKTIEEYNSHEEYEDYDYGECMMIITDKLLDDYYKDISKNLEKIYIIQSIIYCDFYEIYYEFYCYIKKLTSMNLGI